MDGVSGAETAPRRKVIHIDMDAFYAAIEQRDRPELRGRPIAVGGGGRRGVVTTASYEARPFGVRSAMPGAVARRLCPDLVFVEPRFDHYKAVSRQIRALFLEETDLVEPLSLDEAYLDVTRTRTGAPAEEPAVAIARRLKQAIRARTGLTASAGVSFNKFLAKIASDLKKPDGLCVIRPEKAKAFIAELPIERFHGVGPATAKRMHEHGIRTGADLQAMDEARLVALFGQAGRHYGRIAQARDDRPVEPDRTRKSLSVETTFATDRRHPEEIREALGTLAEQLARRLERAGYAGRTVTLKLKYADFRLRTRSLTAPRPPLSADELFAHAVHLLERQPLEAPLRLLGLGVANHGVDIGAETEEAQLSLPLELKESRSAAR